MLDLRTAAYGATALRITLGLMFISHAYLKFAIFTVPGFEGYLAAQGLPTFLAWPIILGEFIGGTAILVGFYGRVVSLALIPLLVGALMVHAPNAGCSMWPAAAGNIPLSSPWRPLRRACSATAPSP